MTKQPSELERTFDYHWRVFNGPDLEPEFRFHSSRKWRFDRAHTGAKVAIELEGGTWSGGRHTTGQGFSKDCEKYNQASLLNWTVFRLTSDMLSNDPVRHLAPVIKFIRDRQSR